MSFVLEALKRSEQQRHVASAPNLGSYVLPSRRSGRDWPLGWLAAAAGLLLVASLLGWWLGQRQPETPPAVPAAIAAAPAQLPAQPPTQVPAEITATRPQPAATTPAPLPPASLPQTRTQKPPAVMPPPAPLTPPRPVPVPMAAAVARAPVPAVIAPSPVPLAQASVPVAAPAAVQSPPLSVALPSLAKAKPAEPAPPPANAASGEVIGYAELPAAVRQSLPEMRLSGYMLDNNGRGLVGVNDLLVGEGEEVSPGLVVEKIDTSGVVFRYRQYRFKR
jgi:general secretion pathway protein B